MKQIIRLTESELHKIIDNAVVKCLQEEYVVSVKQINEDGGMVGGAAANASGFMNGANNAQTSSNAQFDVPFGGVQRRGIYSPKSKKSNKMTEVDMSDALKRHDGKGGSISIPKNHA